MRFNRLMQIIRNKRGATLWHLKAIELQADGSINEVIGIIGQLKVIRKRKGITLAEPELHFYFNKMFEEVYFELKASVKINDIVYLIEEVIDET